MVHRVQTSGHKRIGSVIGGSKAKGSQAPSFVPHPPPLLRRHMDCSKLKTTNGSDTVTVNEKIVR